MNQTFEIMFTDAKVLAQLVISDYLPPVSGQW